MIKFMTFKTITFLLLTTQFVLAADATTAPGDDPNLGETQNGVENRTISKPDGSASTFTNNTGVDCCHVGPKPANMARAANTTPQKGSLPGSAEGDDSSR